MSIYRSSTNLTVTTKIRTSDSGPELLSFAGLRPTSELLIGTRTSNFRRVMPNVRTSNRGPGHLTFAGFYCEQCSACVPLFGLF